MFSYVDFKHDTSNSQMLISKSQPCMLHNSDQHSRLLNLVRDNLTWPHSRNNIAKTWKDVGLASSPAIIAEFEPCMSQDKHHTTEDVVRRQSQQLHAANLVLESLVASTGPDTSQYAGTPAV